MDPADPRDFQHHAAAGHLGLPDQPPSMDVAENVLMPEALAQRQLALGAGAGSQRAANEPGRQVVADLFPLHLPEGVEIVPGAEIAEARWVDPACDDIPSRR